MLMQCYRNAKLMCITFYKDRFVSAEPSHDEAVVEADSFYQLIRDTAFPLVASDQHVSDPHKPFQFPMPPRGNIGPPWVSTPMQGPMVDNVRKFKTCGEARGCTLITVPSLVDIIVERAAGAGRPAMQPGQFMSADVALVCMLQWLDTTMGVLKGYTSDSPNTALKRAMVDWFYEHQPAWYPVPRDKFFKGDLGMTYLLIAYPHVIPPPLTRSTCSVWFSAKSHAAVLGFRSRQAEWEQCLARWEQGVKQIADLLEATARHFLLVMHKRYPTLVYPDYVNMHAPPPPPPPPPPMPPAQREAYEVAAEIRAAALATLAQAEQNMRDARRTAPGQWYQGKGGIYVKPGDGSAPTGPPGAPQPPQEAAQPGDRDAFPLGVDVMAQARQ
jgi:hypothetical protein